MSNFAWVTLATTDSYALGGLVLANSLKRVSTAHQLVILVTPTVSGSMRNKLASIFDLVQEVNVLDSQDTANLALLKRPELGITFTKLHCWRLTQFEKCVFLDADTLVLQNSDELFEREELSAAPDVGWPDCFNTGVFVYRPSLDTYGKILEFAVTKGSFDGGDQGLLNSYFSDWATSDIRKHLPFAYNTASTATYSYLPAFKQFGANTKILHFIGVVKPWLQNFDSQSQTVQTPFGYQHLGGFLQDWWNIFCENVHPNLDSTMSASVPDVQEHLQSLIGIHKDDRKEQYRMRQIDGISWNTLFQSPLYIPYSYKNPHYVPQHFQTGSVCYENKHIPNQTENLFYDPWEEYLSRQENEKQINSNEIHLETFQLIEHFEMHPTHEHSDNCPENLYEVVVQDVNNGQEVELRLEPIQPETVNEQESSDQSPAVTKSDCASHNTMSEEHLNISVEISNNNTNYSNEKDESPINSPTDNDPPKANNHFPFIETNVTNANVVTVDEHVDSASSKCKETELETSEEHGLVGALAQLKLGAPRTAEQIAYEDLMRRQCWESGMIDFAGRDSFANIWARIEQTINTDSSAMAGEIAPVATPAPEDPTTQCVNLGQQGETTTFDPATNTTTVTTRIAEGYKQVSTTINADGTKSIQTKVFNDPVEETEEEEIIETTNTGMSKQQSLSQKQSVSQQSVTQQQSGTQSITQRRSSQSSATQQIQVRRSSQQHQQSEMSQTIVQSSADSQQVVSMSTQATSEVQESVQVKQQQMLKQMQNTSAKQMQSINSITQNTQSIVDNVTQQMAQATSALNTQSTSIKDSSQTSVATTKNTTTDVATAGGKTTKVIEKFDGGYKEKYTTVYPDGRQTYEEKTIFDTVEEEITESTVEISESGTATKLSAQNIKQDTQAVTSVTGNTLTQQVAQVTSSQSTHVSNTTNTKDINNSTTTETTTDGGKRTKVIEKFNGGYKEKYTTVYPDGRQTYEEKTFYDTVQQETSETTSQTTTSGKVTKVNAQNLKQELQAVTNVTEDTVTQQIARNTQQTNVKNTNNTNTTNVTSTKNVENTSNVVDTTTTEMTPDGGKRTKVVEKFDGGYKEKYTTVYLDGRQTYEEKTFYDTVQEEVSETTTETTTTGKVTKVDALNSKKDTLAISNEDTVTQQIIQNTEQTNVQNEKNTVETTDATNTKNVKSTTNVVDTTTSEITPDGGKLTKVVEKFDGGYKEKYTTVYPDGRQTYEEKTFYDTVQEEVSETTTETTTTGKVTKVIAQNVKQDTQAITNVTEDTVIQQVAQNTQITNVKNVDTTAVTGVTDSIDVTNTKNNKTTTNVVDTTTTETTPDGGKLTKVVEKFDGGYKEKYTTVYPDGRQTYEEKTFYDTVQEEVSETTTETTTTGKVTKVIAQNVKQDTQAITNVTEDTVIQQVAQNTQITNVKNVDTTAVTGVTDSIDVTNTKNNKTTTNVVDTTTTETTPDGGKLTKVVEKFDGGYKEKYTTVYPDGRQTYEEKTFYDTVQEEVSETTTETTTTGKVTKVIAQNVKQDTQAITNVTEDTVIQQVAQNTQITNVKNVDTTAVTGVTDSIDVTNTKNNKTTTNVVDKTTTETTHDGGKQTKVIEKFDGGYKEKLTTVYPDGRQTYEEKTFFDTVEEEVSETTTETTTTGKVTKVNAQNVKQDNQVITNVTEDTVIQQVMTVDTTAATEVTDSTDITNKKNVENTTNVVETTTTETTPDGGKQTKVVEKFDGGCKEKYTTVYPDGRQTYEEKTFYDTVQEETSETITETTTTGKVTKENTQNVKQVTEATTNVTEETVIQQVAQNTQQTKVNNVDTTEITEITESTEEINTNNNKNIVDTTTNEVTPDGGKQTKVIEKFDGGYREKLTTVYPDGRQTYEEKTFFDTVKEETSETTTNTTATVTKCDAQKVTQDTQAITDETLDTVIQQAAPNTQLTTTVDITEITEVTDVQNTKNVENTTTTDVVDKKVKNTTDVVDSKQDTQTVTNLTEEIVTQQVLQNTLLTNVENTKNTNTTVETTEITDVSDVTNTNNVEKTITTDVSDVTDTTTQNVNNTTDDVDSKKDTQNTINVTEDTTTQQVLQNTKLTNVENTKTTNNTSTTVDTTVIIDVTDTKNVENITNVGDTTTTETAPDGGKQTKIIEKFDGGYKEKLTTVYPDGRQTYEEKTYFDTVEEEISETTTETITTGTTTKVNAQNVKQDTQAITNITEDTMTQQIAQNITEITDVTEVTDVQNTQHVDTNTAEIVDVTNVTDTNITKVNSQNIKQDTQTVTEDTVTQQVAQNITEMTNVTNVTDTMNVQNRTKINNQDVTQNTQTITNVTEDTVTQQLAQKTQLKNVKNAKNTKTSTVDTSTTEITDVTDVTNTKNVKNSTSVVDSTTTEMLPDGGKVTKVVEKFNGGYTEKYTTVYPDGREAYEEKTFYDTVQLDVTDTENVTNSSDIVESTTTETISDGGQQTRVIEKFDGGYKEKYTTVYPDGKQTYSEKTFFDTVQTDVSETTKQTTTTGKVTKVNAQNVNVTEDTLVEQVAQNKHLTNVNNVKNTNTTIDTTKTTDVTDVTEISTNDVKNTSQNVTQDTQTTTNVIQQKNTQLTNVTNAKNTNTEVTNTINVKNSTNTVVSTTTETTSDGGQLTKVVEKIDGGYTEKYTTVYPDGRQTYSEKTFFDTVQTELSETTTETTTSGKVTKVNAQNLNQNTQAVTNVTEDTVTDQLAQLTTAQNTQVTDTKNSSNATNITATQVSQVTSNTTVQQNVTTTSTDVIPVEGKVTKVVEKFDGGYKEKYTTVYPDGRQAYEEKVFYDTVEEEVSESVTETTATGKVTSLNSKNVKQASKAVTAKTEGTQVTATQVTQTSKLQSTKTSTKDAAVTAKVDNVSKGVVKKDTKSITETEATAKKTTQVSASKSANTKTTKTVSKDTKDTSQVLTSEVIPAEGKTTKVIEKFDGGYKEVYTTVFPDGRQTNEEKTFFDTVEQTESKTTTEKLVGGRVTKTKDINSSRKVSTTSTEKKNLTSTGTTTSAVKSTAALDKNTTMVIEKFENGYKEVYTTTRPDGTKGIKVKTFYDEVEEERIEQTKQKTTVADGQKKTTTGETVVTENTKVKRKIMPKGVEIVNKATPITDESKEDRLGRKASLGTDGTTKMVVEKFENGYKEIYTTVYPDGRVKTEVQTFYDSEEEEEIEEYFETDEAEPVVTSPSNAVVDESKKSSELKNSASKVTTDTVGKLKKVPKAPVEEAAAGTDVSKLKREKFAMFEDQSATAAVAKAPTRVWKRQPAATTTSITEPTTGATPVPPPRKKEIKTNYLRK